MIRPLIMPVLLALAALACSIDISTAHFENARLYKTEAREDSTRSFAPDDTVFCIVDVKDVDGTLPVRVVWSRVMEAGETGSPVMTPLDETTVDQGNGQLVIAIPPPDGGWQRGAYVVDLYLDGDKKQTLNFSVK